jgi:D-threo-aldose 1-dehydrogenase
VKTRQIGRTSTFVTELGFGGASVGNLHRVTTDEEARAAVDRAWDVGIRYFDTAPHYGLGLSETRLGAALADRPREEFVLSTKVGRLLEPNPAPTGSDLTAGGFDVPDVLRRRFDFSGDAVQRSLESSLGRLGVDRVDIVYVHDPDDYVADAVSQAIPTLIGLREQGVIGAVGVGINQWSPALQILRECDIDVVMLAGRWTLADRTGEPLLVQAVARGVSVVTAAPYNSGLLARPWPADGSYFDYAPASAEVLARARRMAWICERAGLTLPDAAVQFPLRSPVVASVVCGMRTDSQVQSTLDRMNVVVDDDIWNELDQESLTE